uniref:Uncharacterized protein n=1 Tax=Glossina pallidipes TaxID=7398 RepID=A0A1B0ACB2_GLOPL
MGRGPRKGKKGSQLEVSAESDRGQNSCFDADMSSDDETMNVGEPERTSTKRGSSNVSIESAEEAKKARSEANKRNKKEFTLYGQGNLKTALQKCFIDKTGFEYFSFQTPLYAHVTTIESKDGLIGDL